MTSIRKPEPSPIEPEPNDTARLIGVAVDAALSRKAEALLVLDLATISDFTESFLICSGTNERQVQAIADTVIKKLRAEGARPLHVEGLRHGRWVLLDYGGDMVIHVFLDETRQFYSLERLWSDAPDITSRFVH